MTPATDLAHVAGSNPAVQAAWISSSAALGIAVVGVIATGVAQWLSTRRAHSNALALFKVQAQEANKARDAELEERRRVALLEARRMAYVRFLDSTRLFNDAERQRLRLRSEHPYLEQQAQGVPDEATADVRHDYLRLSSEAAKQGASAFSSYEEIALLAPSSVADAAVKFMNAIDGPGDVTRLRYAFLMKAKADVGVASNTT
ncbi:MAG: hypothetical protein H0U36_09890 [Nocardioidaceae bacterium]|nr:hypothetical protein [Nocardioidaceae bacterium]